MFIGRHFDQSVILLCVRWCLAYNISLRGAVDLFMGFVPVLKAFVVGGLGSLPGAVLGGLLLGICEVFLQATLPAEVATYRDALVFAVVGLVLVRFPQGLMGRNVELGDKEW